MSKRTGTDLIVFHCSATRPSQLIGADTIREWHLAKGWADIGYHFVIRRDGIVELGRPLENVGAHVEGYNARSVGICMVGGLREDGTEYTADQEGDFTGAQWWSARTLLAALLLVWPHARVMGHRDLSPDANHNGKIEPREWLKSCPAFDAAKKFAV